MWWYRYSIFKSCCFFTVQNVKVIDGIVKPDIRPILYIDFKIANTDKLCRVYNIHLVAKETPIDKLNETKYPLQKPRYHFAEMLRLIHLTDLKTFLNTGNYVIFCGDHNDEKIQTIYELITQYLNDINPYNFNLILGNQKIRDIKDLYSDLAGNGQLSDEYFNENNRPDINPMNNAAMNTIGGRKTKKSKPRKKTKKPRKKNKPRKKTIKNKSRKKQKIY